MPEVNSLLETAKHLIAVNDQVEALLPSPAGQKDAMSRAAEVMRAYVNLVPVSEHMSVQIVRWAEHRAIKAQLPIWHYVSQFLVTGSTRAVEFCAKHLPSIGWNNVNEKQPFAGVVVYTAEDLGDTPYRMMVDSHGQWFRAKRTKAAEKVLYTPEWWKVAT